MGRLNYNAWDSLAFRTSEYAGDDPKVADSQLRMVTRIFDFCKKDIAALGVLPYNLDQAKRASEWFSSDDTTDDDLMMASTEDPSHIAGDMFVRKWWPERFQEITHEHPFIKPIDLAIAITTNPHQPADKAPPPTCSLAGPPSPSSSSTSSDDFQDCEEGLPIAYDSIEQDLRQPSLRRSSTSSSKQLARPQHSDPRRPPSQQSGRTANTHPSSPESGFDPDVDESLPGSSYGGSTHSLGPIRSKPVTTTQRYQPYSKNSRRARPFQPNVPAEHIGKLVHIGWDKRQLQQLVEDGVPLDGRGTNDYRRVVAASFSFTSVGTVKMNTRVRKCNQQSLFSNVHYNSDLPTIRAKYLHWTSVTTIQQKDVVAIPSLQGYTGEELKIEIARRARGGADTQVEEEFTPLPDGWDN